jgi:hypothetical protein
MWSVPRCYEQDSLKQRVHLRSARGGLRCYNQLGVESPAVKRRLYVCCTYNGRVAANILNKQSRTADKGWPSSLGVGRGANNSSP